MEKEALGQSNLPTTIIPYLSFNGNCLEAMKFYQECFGGDLYYQTVDETQGLKKKDQRSLRDCIIHARLKNDLITIMGSDIVPGDQKISGNSISISVITNNESLIQTYFKRLSKNAKEIVPINKTNWGTFFGSLTDKFDNHWMFILNPKSY